MSTTIAARDLSLTPSRFARGRRSFRAWRWTRPFWAGLLTMLSGLPIMYFPYANMQIGDLSIRMATTAGAGSLIIGVLLVTLGLTMWFQPETRVFAGVATLVLVLVSLVVSNVGGLLMGFLLGLFGGGMSVAWAPGAPGGQAGHSAESADGGAERGSPAGSAVAEDAAPALPAPRAGTGSALDGFTAANTTKGKG